MKEAVIVSGARTAIGGLARLKDVPAIDLPPGNPRSAQASQPAADG